MLSLAVAVRHGPSGDQMERHVALCILQGIIPRE